MGVGVGVDVRACGCGRMWVWVWEDVGVGVEHVVWVWVWMWEHVGVVVLWYRSSLLSSVSVTAIIWLLRLCCHNYFPSLRVCPDITTATGELHVFDFDLDKEDRCSVADKLWDSL